MQEFILHETNKSQFWLVLKQILSTGKRWHIKISEYREKRSYLKTASCGNGTRK